MNDTQTEISKELEAERRLINMETNINDIIKRLESLEKSFTTQMDRIDRRLDESFVTVKEYSKDKQIINMQIEDIKRDNESGKSKWDWVIKTVMGAIIAALLGIIIIGK